MASNQLTWSALPDPATLSAEKGAAHLREIVVFIDGNVKTAGILEFASVLAEEHGARLISVFMQPEPTVTPAETFARGKGMQSVSQVHRAQLDEIEVHHRAVFEDLVPVLSV
jgi:precorrin-6B methylase 2